MAKMVRTSNIEKKRLFVSVLSSMLRVISRLRFAGLGCHA